MQATLAQLTYFAAVAEGRSFTAAARALEVRQPTVSAAVAELEALVGTALFRRSRGGAELTPAGRDLLGRARAVLAALDDFGEGVARLRNPELKLLRLVYSPVLDVRTLNRLAEAYVADNPGLQVVFKECNVVDLQARVEAQQADVVFAPRGIGNPEWRRCALYRERLRYVPPGGSRGGPASITLEEISRGRLLLPEGVCGLAKVVRTLFRGARLPIDEYPGRAISFGALEELAELGLGGTILPESKVRTADPLPVVVLDGAPALLTYDAMWPKDILARYSQSFAKSLPELARGLFPSTQGLWAPAPLAPGRARAGR